MKKAVLLLGCMALPLAVGGLAWYLATLFSSGEWFTALIKPGLLPSSHLLLITEMVLFVLMGISLFIIATAKESNNRTNAILIFCIQLFLNFWWGVFFFRFQRTDLAFAELFLLWLTVVWMILSYKKINLTAAWLQIPYLLWVSMALVINYQFWVLNK